MRLKRFWHRTRLRFIRQPTPFQADRTPVIETAGLTIVYRDFRRRSLRFLTNLEINRFVLRIRSSWIAPPSQDQHCRRTSRPAKILLHRQLPMRAGQPCIVQPSDLGNVLRRTKPTRTYIQLDLPSPIPSISACPKSQPPARHLPLPAGFSIQAFRHCFSGFDLTAPAHAGTATRVSAARVAQRPSPARLPALGPLRKSSPFSFVTVPYTQCLCQHGPRNGPS